MKLGNKCQCAVCNQIFKSVTGFDRHRVGVYPDRRCLSEQEMQDRGFSQRSDGVWITKAFAWDKKQAIVA